MFDQIPSLDDICESLTENEVAEFVLQVLAIPAFIDAFVGRTCDLLYKELTKQ